MGTTLSTMLSSVKTITLSSPRGDKQTGCFLKYLHAMREKSSEKSHRREGRRSCWGHITTCCKVTKHSAWEKFPVRPPFFALQESDDWLLYPWPTWQSAAHTSPTSQHTSPVRAPSAAVKLGACLPPPCVLSAPNKLHFLKVSPYHYPINSSCTLIFFNSTKQTFGKL